MRSCHLCHLFVSAFSFLRSAFVYAFEAVVNLARYVLHEVSPKAFVRQRGELLKLAAFRIIGLLKPDYRASYETHGLSLEGLRRPF